MASPSDLPPAPVQLDGLLVVVLRDGHIADLGLHIAQTLEGIGQSQGRAFLAVDLNSLRVELLGFQCVASPLFQVAEALQGVGQPQIISLNPIQPHGFFVIRACRIEAA